MNIFGFLKSSPTVNSISFRRLRTSPWALKESDQHFSPLSEIYGQKQLIEKMIASLRMNEMKIIVSFSPTVNPTCISYIRCNPLNPALKITLNVDTQGFKNF